MEFLNPTALYGFLGLPLLLLPYLLRRKPRRYVFSSLLIFSAMGHEPTVRPWGRLRLPLIFFLQLLLLALMIVALSEPVLTARPAKVAVVLDNSASMQAFDESKPRFVLAQEKLAEIVSELSSAAVLELYLTAPQLERFGKTGFSPLEALAAVRGLKPVDVAEAQLDYNESLGQLARQQEYDRIYFITDRPARGQNETIRVLTVGRPRDNLAISSLMVHHGSLADPRLTAGAEVANFSATEVRVKVTLRGGGMALGTRELDIAAGGNATAIFEGLPQHPFYEAEINRKDALLLDNRRFAVTPGAKKLRILGISPRPEALTSLRAINGVEVDIVTPVDYEKTDRSGYGLEIFHFAAPTELPRNPALFILPPDQSQLVNSRQAGSNQGISGWREGHPLTRYVNFALLRPSYTRTLIPQIPGESILRSAAGTLAFTTMKQGVRYLVLGFDPLPFLGHANLPMSIFTVNIVDWFFAFSPSAGRATGEPITVNAPQPGDRIITPLGETLSPRPDAAGFPRTLYQGVYQLVRQNQKSFIAVNLREVSESDLRRPASVELRGESGNGREQAILLPSWSYFLLAALLLLVVEWFINPRFARRGHRSHGPVSLPHRA
jgi:Aerotolerance regulator N-terminal